MKTIVEKSMRCKYCNQVFSFRSDSPLLKLMYELAEWRGESKRHECIGARFENAHK